MVNVFTLPFGILEEAPFINGVSDVDIEIPEITDILQIVDEQVPDDDEFVDLVVDGLEEGVEDSLPVGPIADAVLDVLEDNVLDLFDPVIDLLLEEIDDELEDVEEDIGGIVADTDELADSITDQIDDGELSGTLVSFESVFGALSEDIAEGLQTALDESLEGFEPLPDDIGEILDNQSDLSDAIDDIDPLEDIDFVEVFGFALEETLEGLPAGDFFFETSEFIDSQLFRVTDGLVSEEAQANLDQAVEEFG